MSADVSLTAGVSASPACGSHRVVGEEKNKTTNSRKDVKLSR